MSLDYFLREALRINNKKHDKTKQNHIAFIVYKNKIVSIGYNKSKSNPATKRYNYKKLTEHTCAELSACINAYGVNFNKCTMIVMRLRFNGELAFSKPCDGCQHLIQQLGFKKVIYSTNEGEFECL